MVTPSYVGFYAAIGITKTVAEESPHEAGFIGRWVKSTGRLRAAA